MAAQHAAKLAEHAFRNDRPSDSKYVPNMTARIASPYSFESDVQDGALRIDLSRQFCRRTPTIITVEAVLALGMLESSQSRRSWPFTQMLRFSFQMMSPEIE